MDILIGSIASATQKISDFFERCLNVFASVEEALVTLNSMLADLTVRIHAMTASAKTGTFAGMPINKAIGMMHFLFGDIAFYFLYCIILFGCLFTIYKLVSLLIQGMFALYNSISISFTKGAIGGLLGKVFKP